MKRRLLNLLTALSLLLCVAVVALWVRSYGGKDLYERHSWHAATRTFREYQVVSKSGVIYLRLWREVHDVGPAAADHVPYGYANDGDVSSTWRHRFIVEPIWEPFPLWPEARTGPEGAGFSFRLLSHMVTRKDAGLVRYSCRTISCPLWVPAVVAALLPGMYAIRTTCGHVTGRRRHNSGLCPSCRYDLIANVSGVCPECGEAV